MDQLAGSLVEKDAGLWVKGVERKPIFKSFVWKKIVTVNVVKCGYPQYENTSTPVGNWARDVKGVSQKEI